MTILSKLLRRRLETAIRQAREIAEEAAQEAIARIGIADIEAPFHLTEDNRVLRRRLRAHGRALGDTRDAAGVMTTARLQEAAAYEIWHRMLFGRFLVERGLLIHPDLGAAISLAELRDLAKEEGAADEWALAEQYAAPALPGVFKPDDPVLALQIAPEFSKRLRAVLSALPEEVFTADDSLGWTYENWRGAEKEAVDEKVKRGAKVQQHELPAKTQLFTEPYMVKFLLHNTLGAWWAGKVLALDPSLARNAVDEDALREACALPGVTWEFLRFVRDDDGRAQWRPAAGTFPGWPIRAAEITYCDPCCGSGHFLVEAFAILAALRRQEEALSAVGAANAVLRDNLHGLELDGRCVQIAAFNVALAAWKLAGAPVALPLPHIAWVGAPPPMSRTEMAALAEGDSALCRALETLYDQFVQAPVLGSLLEIGARDLLDADLRERGDAALAKLHGTEPEQTEGAVAARGLQAAALLLCRGYVLIATNVPFLGRKYQQSGLAELIDQRFPKSKYDLSTAMIERLLSALADGGTLASVTKQEWTFLKSFQKIRRHILEGFAIQFLVTLGEEAWEAFGDRGPLATLCSMTATKPAYQTAHFALDLTKISSREEKICRLSDMVCAQIAQQRQITNPDAIISPVLIGTGKLLNAYADAVEGLSTGDGDRFVHAFWEIPWSLKGWVPFAGAPDGVSEISGRHQALKWDDGCGPLSKEGGARVQGYAAWKRQGVIVGEMRALPIGPYFGDIHTKITAAIVPKDPKHLAAIYAFTRSGEYSRHVRDLNRKLSVATATLTKVPFDLARWQTEAAESYSHGLPEPYSNHPAQWLFHGHPAYAECGTELHVALARLAGYRWPSETDATIRLSDLAKQHIGVAATLADSGGDGLLPLQANGNDLPLADRMRILLTAAYGTPISPVREQALVRAADALLDKKGAKDTTLEGWLADRAFRQHCVLFRHRPFLWHVWDSMRDGFSAFLNYHSLDRGALDKLTYTLLGDWIRTAKAEGNSARLERAERLQQTLAKIIEGENPFDIFVRWKPLTRQPIGWEPDLDDGVRLNIRPFMTAGILREQPRGVSWSKDKGSDPASAPWFHLGSHYGGKQGDRINDHHLTLAEKRAARGTL
jgi:hypothetical protein